MHLLVIIYGKCVILTGLRNMNKADRPANSRERWAGALMEVRSLFGWNSAVKKTRYRRTDGRTDPNIESLVRD